MVKSKDNETITLPEPPEGSYLHSEVITHTKSDFFGRVWTLKYRSWTLNNRAVYVQVQDYLAYCFYTPDGEGKLSRIVPRDSENTAVNEMFRYFDWFIFSHESKLIDVDMVGETSQKPAVQNVKRLTGKRTNIKEVS
jgi:hypothetical protein